MTFLTSYSSRSIGARVGVAVVASIPCVVHPVSIGSVRRQAGGAAGDIDRHGEADPDEHVVAGSG